MLIYFLSNLGMGGSSGPATAQAFRQALTAKLGSIPELTGIVGEAIYPGVVPETHDFTRDGPALTWTIATNPRGHVLSGSDGTSTARVQLGAYSYGVSDTDAITSAVFNALDGLCNDSSWGDGSAVIMSCTQQEEVDLPEQVGIGTDLWLHRIQSDYQIKYRVSIPAHS